MIPKKAFTLVELLVVIVIVVLQLVIIMPLLGASREQAFEAVCLSNQKQLSLAWTSYYNDNDGLLVGGSNYYSGSKGTPYRWVEFPLYHDTDNPENTAPVSTAQYSLEYRKNGIRAGSMWPYTGDENLYHCPADNTITQAEPSAVFRSYEISGLMNSEDFVSRSGDIYSPISDYRSAIVDPGTPAIELIVATNISDITTPSSNYVFVEADVSGKPSPWNQTHSGGWILFVGGSFSWWDWPASFHNDTGTFGFADGHAQLRQWQDPDTINMINSGMPDPNPNGNEDLIWLANGYVPVRP